MAGRIPIGIVGCVLATQPAIGAEPPGGHASKGDAPPSRSMEREPDYAAILEKEYLASVAEGTRAALIRFIARHPEHALADDAWRRLEAAASLPMSLPGSRDTDAGVYAAFDRAVRMDTPAAYDTFIARYAPHPLVAEAERRRDIGRRYDAPARD